MRNGRYGLGIDVGDRRIAVAVCEDDGPTARPLPPPPVPEGTLRSLLAHTGTATPVRVGGREVAAADLLAEVVQQVREAAAATRGRPDGWTVVTVPPSWDGPRCAALADALQRAGVPRFTLLSRAVAATARQVAVGRLRAGATVAVYDLGPSRLELAVVGPAPDGSAALDQLAAPPDPVSWAVRPAPGESDELLADRTRESAAAVVAAAAAAGLAVGDLDAVVLTGAGAGAPRVAEVLGDELDRPLVVGPDPALTAALGASGLAAWALSVDTAVDTTVDAAADTTPGAGTPAGRPAAVAGAARGSSPSAPPSRSCEGSGPARNRRRRRTGLVAALLALLVVVPATLDEVLGATDEAGTSAARDATTQADDPAPGPDTPEDDVPAPAGEGPDEVPAQDDGPDGRTPPAPGTARAGSSASGGGGTSGTRDHARDHARHHARHHAPPDDTPRP